MPIAVSAATGQLGRIVVAKLKEKHPAAQIVALARSPEKAADLGVAVRHADYTRPETLGPALTGIDTLLLISSSEIGQRAAQHRNAIDAAVKARVERIVYTSLLHADTSILHNIADEHAQTEAMLKASGLAYTILRNGWYCENYTGFIGAALAGGAFLGAAQAGKISGAPRLDYAEAAVVALTTPGHAGKIYELAADKAWTLTDLAAEISKQTGKQIPYRNLSEADYAAALIGFGLPSQMAAAIAGWDSGAAQGALFDGSRQLSALIGRATTALAVPVAEALRRVKQSA